MICMPWRRTLKKTQTLAGSSCSNNYNKAWRKQQPTNPEVFFCELQRILLQQRVCFSHMTGLPLNNKFRNPDIIPLKIQTSPLKREGRTIKPTPSSIDLQPHWSSCSSPSSTTTWTLGNRKHRREREDFKGVKAERVERRSWGSRKRLQEVLGFASASSWWGGRRKVQTLVPFSLSPTHNDCSSLCSCLHISLSSLSLCNLLHVAALSGFL